MYKFKIKLIEFVKELMDLFEDKNKIIYKRLINYFHQINNRLDEDELYDLVKNFFSQDHVNKMIASENRKFVKDTPLELDVELLWDSCTLKNKKIIWKWVNVIIESLNEENFSY